MPKRYIIDIYCEIDEEDLNSSLELLEGDIKDADTGQLFTGTFVIKELKELDKYEERITSDTQL